jgi:N,N'-diacetyllegionaminate synthase
MIEKHFTLDRDLPGPDHRFSSNPAELADLVRQVRAAEVALGTGVVGPTPSEEAGRRDFRLSCVAARNLNAGHRLERADVAFRRPGTGLAPQERDRLVGRELMHGLPRGHVFSDSDFR